MVATPGIGRESARHGSSPLRVDLWKKDATWPVQESGAGYYSKVVGDNWSLDIDISIARRTMRAARTVRRPGISGMVQTERPRSTPLVRRGVAAPGLPLVLGSARSSPSSPPSTSSPAPARSSGIASGRSSAPPTSGRACASKPLLSRPEDGRRSNSAMAVRGASSSAAYATTTYTNHVVDCAVDGNDYFDNEVMLRNGIVRPDSPAQRLLQAHADQAILNRSRPSPKSDTSSSALTPTPPPGPCAADPPRTRSELVKWCFYYKKEAISTRLQILDHSIFGEAHRNHVYLQREDEVDDDSEVGNIFNLYEQLGVKRLPQTGHPAALEGWHWREGGFSRTSEILTAFEVLNFYRWLCRLPRLRLDSFRQQLADMVLQVLTTRDKRCYMQPEGVPMMNQFFEDFSKYVSGNNGRAIIVSQIPALPSAVRLLLSGMPSGSAPPQILFGADIPATPLRCELAELAIPRGAEAALRDYLPLLQLRDPSQSDDSATVEDAGEKLSDDVSTPVFQEAAHDPNVAGPHRVQSITIDHHVFESQTSFVPEKPKKHSTQAWGDERGILAFRRAVMDPRLRSTGLLRRGCRTCVWIDKHIQGEPDIIPEEERDPFGMHFLDQEVNEDADRPKTSEPLRHFQRWREDMNQRLKTTFVTESVNTSPSRHARDSTFGRGPDNLVVGGEAAAFFNQSFRSSFNSEQGGGAGHHGMSFRRVMSTKSTAGRSTTDLLGEHLFEDEGTHRDPGYLHCDEDDEHPLMVCFPPPGIVPIEMVQEAPLLWTISPDPQRLMPTAGCNVQVYRVRIDVQLGQATRLDDESVPLANFCVDCTNIGTPFCVIFKLAADVKAGDQFEIVLGGVAGQHGSLGTGLNLTYFVSFEVFKPSIWDISPLRRRAGDLLKSYQVDHVWQDPFMYVPELHHGDDELFSNATSGGRKTPGGKSTPKEAPRASVKLAAERASWVDFSTKRPPSLGIIGHPNGTSRSRQDRYTIDVPSGNEVSFALLVPSTVVISASVQAFVKSSAKWEYLPNAAFLTYFKEETSCKDFLKHQQLPWEKFRHQPEPFHLAPPQKHRVVCRVMLPVVGRYEIRFQWGFVPNDSANCRNLNSLVIPHEHPLRVVLLVGSKVPNFRPLVPTMYHSTAKRVGYPLKHPLAEHWGVTIVGPMRYRLRLGYVRFTLHVRQGKTALNEADAAAAGAAVVAVEAKGNLRLEADRLSPRASEELVISPASARSLRKAGSDIPEKSSATSSIAVIPEDNSPIRAQMAERGPIIKQPALASRNASLASELGKLPGSRAASLEGQPISPQQSGALTKKGRVGFIDEIRLAHVMKMKAETDSDDSDVPNVQQERPRNQAPESNIAHVSLPEIQRRVKRRLTKQMRRGTNGQICVVAVVGSWRRVELLRRRPLEPPPPPEAVLNMAAMAGSAVASAAADVAVAKHTEVHEAILNFTDEDQGQVVQLLAFQIGAADASEALEAITSAGSAPSEAGSDMSPRTRKLNRSKASASNVDRRLSTSSWLGELGGEESSGLHRTRDKVAAHLGQLKPPSRWCVAEFVVDGAHPLPYDEDEMKKPLPPTRDPMELIGVVA